MPSFVVSCGMWPRSPSAAAGDSSQQKDASCASWHHKRVNEGIDGRRSQLAQIELDDELNGSRCVQDEEAAGRHRDHAADGQSRTSR